MADLEELQEAVLIEDVLEQEGLDYRITHGSRGEQINLRECPFCGGDDWKVYVNRDSGLGNCFHGSCQETFNLIKFTKRVIENRGGRGVVNYLQKLAAGLGWRPGRRERVDVETFDADDWSLPDNIALPDRNGNNLVYLTKRGVDDATTRWFDLRYCHDGWFNYTKPDGSHGGIYFGRRVIFPVYDLDGTLTTFQGRDITGESDRKYLFPARLPGTSRFLYNGYRAFRKRRVVLCEGAMDVIGAHVALAEPEPDVGVVGSFGMHLSGGQDGEDQISRLLELKRQGLEEVTIMWDGETGAYKAAVKAARKITQLGIAARVAVLPAGEDPGSAMSRDIVAAFRDAKPAQGASALSMALKNPYR